MHRLWPRLVQTLVIAVLPLALLAASLRAVTSHWLVHWEYGKADFPPDPYGLTTEERIRLAGTCVDYLVTGAGIDLLADLEVEGRPAFNERELRHMEDVKRVQRWLLGLGAGAGVITIGASGALAARPSTRRRAPTALLGGSLLGLGLLAAVGGLMLVQWDVFFTGFHELFFPPGTWMFLYSNTLIRLFPERFWTDVAAVVVGLLVAEAVALGGGAFLWLRFLQRRELTSRQE